MMLQNWEFAKHGADSLKELQNEKKIIYQSKNRLDKSGDSAFNLQASVSLPDDVKKCLGQIRGKFALGRCKDGLKNPHIFMPDAVTQDGYKRICYAYYADGALLVSEYGGTRSGKYSGFYPELEERMVKSGFRTDEKKKIYVIPDKRMEDFVRIVNEMIDEEQQGLFEFQLSEKWECLRFEKRSYYYSTGYWVKKGNTQVTTDKKQEPKKITEYLETIRELVRLTGKYAADCRNMEELAQIQEELDSLHEKLTIIQKLANSRLDALKQLKTL